MYLEGVENKWSKTVENSAVRKTITVYEAVNGFVICEESYIKDDKGGKLSYEDRSKNKLIISKTNPLSDLDKMSDSLKINTIGSVGPNEVVVED